MAADAQRDWAALPYLERAAVLRRAGDLWHANAEEITGWLMRETGAIGPFGGFQVMTSAEECYEAAALRVRPVRRAAAVGAAPAVDGAPGAGRRRRRDLAVQRADDPRHPRGRAGAGAGQRGAAQARPAHRGQRRRTVRRRCSRRPACRRACCTCCRAAPTSARRWSPSRWSGWSRSPARPGPAGRSATLAGQHLKRVHLELGGNSALLVLDDVDPDAGVVRGCLGFVRAPGPGVHDCRPAPGPVAASPTRTSRRCRPGRPGCPSATR